MPSAEGKPKTRHMHVFITVCICRGTGNTTNEPLPVPVAAGLLLLIVSGGSDHTCGLDGSGAAWCWGEPALWAPACIALVAPRACFGGWAASVHRSSCCIPLPCAHFHCFAGANKHGQCGTGDTTDKHQPAAVVGGLTFTSISCGDGHACAIASNQSLFCWG